MKKLVLLALMVISIFSSCSDEEDGSYVIYDFAPINFYFEVVNSNGANILDSTSTAYNKDFVSKTSITLQGKNYTMQGNYKAKVTPTTRKYFTLFYGITIQYESDGKAYAVIGPFMANYTWDQEMVQIHWGDGSEGVLQFSSSYRMKKNVPVFDRNCQYTWGDSTIVFKGSGYIIKKVE
jgi:hypothetical protein